MSFSKVCNSFRILHLRRFRISNILAFYRNIRNILAFWRLRKDSPTPLGRNNMVAGKFSDRVGEYACAFCSVPHGSPNFSDKNAKAGTSGYFSLGANADICVGLIIYWSNSGNTLCGQLHYWQLLLVKYWSHIGCSYRTNISPFLGRYCATIFYIDKYIW